jgi:hypothetical protein
MRSRGGQTPPPRAPRSLSRYRPSVDRAAELTRLAQTYVWWQDPSATLADPRTLLRQILRLGRPEDYVLAEETWGVDALRAALRAARRGEIDPKSASFWRMRLGLPSAT